MRPSPCFLLPLALFAIPACAGGASRAADGPLSAAAEKVQVVRQAPPTCKKVGSAQGRGRDRVDAVAERKATDDAREQTAKLGGDTAHLVTETTEQEAGSGGTYAVVTKTVDVYRCAK